MTTFFDDFNRADGAPGANWVLVSGPWVISSNQLAPGAAGGTIVIRAATAMATNDNSAQITIAATTVASQGVWCRGNTTITQGYLWRNNGTSWDLFSVVGGSFVSIGTYAAAAAPGDVAKIQAVGSTISGYVNGVVRVSVTNTAVTSGTSVGIRSDSAGALRFDDFTGADVTSGATGDAALASAATLSASGVRAAVGDAAQAFAAGFTGSGVLSVIGNAILAAGASLAATGVRTAQADAASTGTATLAASGQTATVGDAALGATATVAAAGRRGVTTGAGLTTTAGLVAQGQVALGGAAALAASVTLAADGTATAQPSSAVLNATAALAAAGTISAARGAVLAVRASLAASGATVSAHGQDVTFTIAPTADRWTAREPAQSRWSAGDAGLRWTARDPNE